MKILKAIVAIACILPAIASASSWSAYDEFMQKHLTDGVLREENGQIKALDMARGMFLAVANDDKSSFDAMYKTWCKVLCNNDVKQYLPATFYPIADERYTDTQAVMLASYTFIEASRLWNDVDVYQSAISSLDLLYNNCTAEVESSGRVLLASNFKQDLHTTVEPSTIPPFAVSNIELAEPRLAPVIYASYQAMVRGFGDGYAADLVRLNANGDVVFTKGLGASFVGTDFLLYLGISSDADPQKRLLKPLFETLRLRLEGELTAPSFVDLYSHEEQGQGTIGFDIAMLNLTSGNIQDLLRTRIKHAQLKQLPLSSQLAALMAMGIDEHRFMFDSLGQLIIRP